MPSIDPGVGLDRRTRRAIDGLGAAAAVTLLMYVLVAPVLAAVAPFGGRGAGGAEGLGLLLSGLPLSPALADWLAGLRPIDPPTFVALYAVFPAIITVIWFAALHVVRRDGRHLAADVPLRLVRWSIAFAVLLVFATPVLVHDFWMSISWGDEVTRGINPYALDPARQVGFPGTPLAANLGRMTYGPLWAMASGAIMFIAGENGLVAALLFKLVISLSWGGIIFLTWKLMAHRSIADQCLAIVSVGWSPLALFQGLADGHNDVVFILPAVAWLWMLERRRPVGASIALAASVAMKYVTAPLFGLQLLRALAQEKVLLRRHMLGALAGGALVVAALGVFHRSWEFFSATMTMRHWEFFAPATVARFMAASAGLPAAPFELLARLVVVAGCLRSLYRYVKAPTDYAFRWATLWVMSTVLLVVVGHVWPWYVIWVLPFAAVDLRSRLVQFVTAFATVAPFVMLPWTVTPAGTPLTWQLDMPGAVLLVVASIAAALPFSIGAAPDPGHRRLSAHGVR